MIRRAVFCLCALMSAALSGWLPDLAHAQAAPPPPAAERPQLSAYLGVGAGVSMRELEVPSFEGPRNLSSGIMPAVQLSLLGRWGDQTQHLAAHMRYQSSVHARVSDQIGDQTTLPSAVSIRSHAFEAGLQPGLALSHASRPAELDLLLGYAVRAFSTVEVLRIPAFSVHGPLLRAQLRLPLSSWLTLSLAPEAQLVLGMSRALRELAGLPRSTWGLGAEAALDLNIHSAWTAGLYFRESHVRALSSEGKRWQDVERYVLVRLSYQVE